MKNLWLIMVLVLSSTPVLLSGVTPKQQRQNLIAFTKLWGYTKHFCPSDEAQEIDWDKFGVYGSQQVMNAPDKEALEKELYELFAPLVPELDLYSKTPQIIAPKPLTPGRKKAFWQYVGYNSNIQSPIYKSIRTNRPLKIYPNDDVPYLWTWVCPQFSDLDHKAEKLRVSFNIMQESSDTDTVRIMMGNWGVSVSDSLCTEGWTQKSYVIEPPDEDHLPLWMYFSGFKKLWLDDLKVETWDNGAWQKLYYTDFSNDKAGSLPQNLSVNMASDMGVLSPKVDVLVDEIDGAKMLKICAAPDKSYTLGLLDRIFSEELPWGERLDKELIPGLRCSFPMILECDIEHTYPPTDIMKLQELKDKLEPIDLGDRCNKGTWLAGIIKYWTELNFFYPYFEYNFCDWDKELGASLGEVLKAKSFTDYKKTLSKLSSKTQDGHAFIDDPLRNKLHPGFGIIPIEGKWVVEKVLNDSMGIPIGSEVTHINGKSFRKIMDECRPMYTSSNPETTNLRLFRAYLRDYPDSVATFSFITPDKRKLTREVKFGDYNSHHLKIRDEKHIVYPDSIVYLNMYRITDEEIKALMPDLKAAKGIILDLRLYPYVSTDILKHFLSKPDSSGYCIAKRYIKPNEELPRQSDDGPIWGLEPDDPHMSAKMIALSSRDSQSYCEGYLEVIKHNKLGTIVGQPSAGANGNVVYSILPGDLRVQWTGLLVKNSDRSRFFGVGISPDVSVTKTIDDIIQGRDPELEKALELLRE